MNYSFEIVKFDKNIPGKILMQEKPGWRCNTTLHLHEELELVYMISGCLNVKINGREMQVKNGDFYFCNSEEIHITKADGANDIHKYIVVLLSYDYMKQYCKNLNGLEFHVEAKSQAYNELKEQLIHLVNLADSEDEYLDLEQFKAILEIYHILLTNCCTYNDSGYRTRTYSDLGCVKQIMKYVYENYKEKITLEEIADMIGYSPQYLSKYFKNITKISFIQYINRVRLESANQDMLNKNYSITNAALENGFSNVKSYINTCKKVYGMTPTQYKKKA